ncbi:MAG: hypothetical protein GY856_48975 [bacterium]|nr:hypothetical protein [bacterium]
MPATSWAVNGRGAAQESADDTLAGVFGFREPTALALSGHGRVQKSPDGIFAEHRRSEIPVRHFCGAQALRDPRTAFLRGTSLQYTFNLIEYAGGRIPKNQLEKEATRILFERENAFITMYAAFAIVESPAGRSLLKAIDLILLCFVEVVGTKPDALLV